MNIASSLYLILSCLYEKGPFLKGKNPVGSRVKHSVPAHILKYVGLQQHLLPGTATLTLKQREKNEGSITFLKGRVGNGISFRKILRNRLGTVFVIPRKKVVIPRSTEESIPQLGTEICRKY